MSLKQIFSILTIMVLIVIGAGMTHASETRKVIANVCECSYSVGKAQSVVFTNDIAIEDVKTIESGITSFVENEPVFIESTSLYVSRKGHPPKLQYLKDVSTNKKVAQSERHAPGKGILNKTPRDCLTEPGYRA